ncbi:hypothetical protein, partial [Erwinia psidii]|uniref:hypothetical protein n=1 Tax=Erwinia psidii TaxID=69224 RepID=UPI00226B2F8A
RHLGLCGGGNGESSATTTGEKDMSQQNINVKVKGAAKGPRNHFENHTGNLWYSPDKDAAWYAHWNGVEWDLEIAGIGLANMKQKYPDLVLITREDFDLLRYHLNCKPVTEISEETFTDMLEVLPPVRYWQCPDNKQGCSFQLEEIFSGGVVDIYVAWEGKFYSLRDDLDLNHAEIIEKVKVSRGILQK